MSPCRPVTPNGRRPCTTATVTGANRSTTGSAALLVKQPAAAAKIDDFVEEHLNSRRADGPPPEFPITSQIDGGLRELRVRFANTRYRVLYQRSGNLLVLLHGLEKRTGAIGAADKRIAQQRFSDFRLRMDAEPRQRPRAAGHDAPSRRGLER